MKTSDRNLVRFIAPPLLAMGLVAALTQRIDPPEPGEARPVPASVTTPEPAVTP